MNMKSFLFFMLLAFANCLQRLPAADTMKRKHFCPTCKSDADALLYSQQRNEWYYNHVGPSATTGANTVFVVEYDADNYVEQDGWWKWNVGPGTKKTTYNCGDLPKVPPFIDAKKGYCYENGRWNYLTEMWTVRPCYPGPFRDVDGHYDRTKTIC